MEIALSYVLRFPCSPQRAATNEYSSYGYFIWPYHSQFRSQWPLACWDCRFESRGERGCLLRVLYVVR